MNAYEPLFWLGCAYLVLRIVDGGSPKLWLGVGVLSGLGLLNKHSSRPRLVWVRRSYVALMVPMSAVFAPIMEQPAIEKWQLGPLPQIYASQWLGTDGGDCRQGL